MLVGQIGVSVDLSGVHPYWLRRNAEARMLGELGMSLLVILRGLRPPQYRPCGERPFREREQEHRILSAGWRNLREDLADALIRGTVPKPAYQNNRMPCGRGFVAFTEETGGRDGNDRWKVEGDKNAVRKRGRDRALVLERDWVPGLVPGVYRDTAEEHRHVGEMRVLREWGIEASHWGGEGLAREVELAREPHEQRRGSEADIFV